MNVRRQHESHPMADKFRAVVFPIVLAIGAIIFFAGGAYLGFDVGSTRGAKWGWLCHTMSTDVYIETLTRLRQNDVEGAKASLEKNVDFHVVLMAPGPGMLDEKTQKALEDTLIGVKRYRDAYPWSGSSSDVNSRVKAVLSEVHSSK